MEDVRFGAVLAALWDAATHGAAPQARQVFGIIAVVMHHMMEKASTIWSKDTGLDRNPADQVEVRRPDGQRDRYLSEDELRRLKQALDEKMYRKGTRTINKTF